jgi:hypothetical protein
MAQQQVKLGQPVNRRLGDLLVADGLLSADQLKKALAEQKGSPEKLGSFLDRLNFRQRRSAHRVPVSAVRRALDHARPARHRSDVPQARAGARSRGSTK